MKPLISQIEKTKDPQCQRTGDHSGAVDVLLFDGAIVTFRKQQNLYMLNTLLNTPKLSMLSLFFKGCFH